MPRPDPRSLLLRLVISAAVVSGLIAGCSAASQTQKIAGQPLTSGSAKVAVSGGTEVSYDVRLEQGRVGSAVTDLVYRSDKGDLFSVVGLGMNGAAKTSNTLAVVVTSGDVAATSAEGECTIELQGTDGGGQSGSVTCDGLDSSQGTLHVEATFSASP
jgi:hypothetical protein